MNLIRSLTIVIAMLAIGTVTNAQEQRGEGQRAERGERDRTDAQRRGGDRDRQADRDTESEEDQSDVFALLAG